MIQIQYTALSLGNVSDLTKPNFYDAFWQSVYLLGFSRFLTIYSLIKNREVVFYSLKPTWMTLESILYCKLERLFLNWLHRSALSVRSSHHDT